ncbi:hypothetical protein GU700_17240 [Methylobacterium sp. NI91]|nr:MULTISPECIES: right-handed parallel beta-helix repeat-containing protein [unclassified Methylobacterium]QIJ76183.1 hypothetical protein CLZ_17235 [Methylobacterium sp. CLZ]QIJ81088.1 hypothetical protein GU700_17240 [Methylobacterium sp. NI91]
MADFPPFAFTTQESWYGELSFKAAEDGSPVSLAGRQFEMHITPAASGASLVAPVLVLTMEEGRGLTLKQGDPSTLVFRVPKATANTFPRQEYTADVLEVVSGDRYLFMPVRITYAEPSGLRSFLTRFLGVSVSFAARQQPIYTPLAVPGREGKPGATIITSTVPPVPADGKDGDFYIEDRSASNQGRRMWGPKSGGQWPGTPWVIQVARIADVPGAGAAAALGVSTAEQAEQADRNDVALTPATGRTLLSALLGATFVQGTFGTTLRRISDWFNDEVNVRSFGAIGDGVSRPLSSVFPSLALARVVYPRCLDLGETIDTAAIREAIYAAIAQGKATRIPGGRYRINRQITPNITSATFNNVRIVGDGKGITILRHDIVAQAGIGWMFGAAGALTPTQVIAAPIQQGSQSVILNNISNYAAGNYIQLIDPEQPIIDHQNDTVVGYCGENLRIRSVDVATKTVTLWSGTEFAYGASATAARMSPVQGFSVEALTIGSPVAGAGGQGALVFKLDVVERLRLAHIEFDGLDDDAVRVSNVIDFDFTDIESRDLRNDLGFTPYLFNINNGCSDGLIAHCRTRRGRHLVTSSSNNLIEPSYVTVSDCHVTEASAAGYDQHPGGGRYWTFSNCQVHGADFLYGDQSEPANPGIAGYQLRGRKTRIINPQVSTVVTGIYLIYGEDNTVEGGEISNTRNAIRVQNSPGAEVKGTKIRNATENGVLVAKGTGTASMGNVVVENIDVIGDPTGAAVNFGTSWDESNRVANVRAPQATRKFVGVPSAHSYGRFCSGVPLPAAAKYQTLDPRLIGNGALAGLTSGTMLLVGIQTEAGELINSASVLFSSGGTNPSNLWCALLDQSRNVLAVSNDYGATPPVAGAMSLFTFVAPVRTAHRGQHYIGLVSVAGIPPSFRGVSPSVNIGTIAPVLVGNSNTGLTNPGSAPAKAVAITPTTNMPYAYLS